MDASEDQAAPENEEANNEKELEPEKSDIKQRATSEGTRAETALSQQSFANSVITRETSEGKRDDIDESGTKDKPDDTNKDDEKNLASPQINRDSAATDDSNAPLVEEEDITRVSNALLMAETQEQENKEVLKEEEQKAEEFEVSASQLVESQDIEQVDKEEEEGLENADSVPSYVGTGSNDSLKDNEVGSTESKVSSRSIPESNLELSATVVKSVEDNEERFRLIEEYKKAVTEHRIAKEANLQLQTKLAEYFRRKKADAVEQQSATSSWGGSTVDAVDYEQRYNKYLASLSELRRQFQEMQISYQKQIEELKTICSQRQEEVERAYTEFTNYKYNIGKKALNSRTGRPINPKDLAALFAAEQKKEAIVMQVRLDNIKLKNEVNKVEAILKAKEELADGLHLIDFEQLKIENQTYNEKIEERNEELSKLRRKISSTVQIMTHVKEKLQAVQQDNAQQKQRLSIADAELTFNRDQLTKLKQNRDRLRAENAKLKRSSGLLGKTSLLLNYEDSVDAVASKKAALKETRELINQYQQQTFRIQRKIEALQESKSPF